MGLISWVRGLYGFFRFLYPRKDKDGRIPGFLYFSDDPLMADYHAEGEPFGRRIFISFARGSLPLAERFERAFRDVGLEPWRYKPEEFSEDAQMHVHGNDNLAKQSRYLEEQYPETLRLLPATLRRCSAVLFLISEESSQKVLCELEAFTAMTIHSGRPSTADAPVYVILDSPESKPSPWLSGFWCRVYEGGLEEALAALIAQEIDGQAAILRLTEKYRQPRYRQERFR